LIQLLESLLDIAANKARKGEITGLASTDLSLLTERICELYADSAEESGHVFSWDIVPGVELPVEEAQFARLVTNLLDNAFKYVPAGGEVRLSLEPGPKLVVQDSGPGIAPEERQKIFERFYRGKSGTQDAQGNGLGLALAQAIAIRHGLEIELEDTMMGACFVVARRDG
jgi:signal transduction histidine kinase